MYLASIATLPLNFFGSFVQLMASGSSDRGLSRILGTGLPTETNWLDEKWLVALFGLSLHGVSFHAFQSWARAVASGISIPLDQELHHLHLQELALVKLPSEALESGAGGISKILGTTLPTREKWLDDQWLQNLFGLSSRGVQFSAFRTWSLNVAMGKPFTVNVDTLSSRKQGLVETLPNLLENKEALKFKSPELAHYVAGLDHYRFYNKEYLEEIKAHMENHKSLYWKRLDVTISIQARLSSTDNGIPHRIREFYNSNPLVHGSDCELVESGSNYKPWVIRCGNSIGVHGIKKAARMIAIIKEHMDPCFDPDGDSPAPSPYLNNRKRKRMQSVNRAIASEDAEVVTVKKRVQVPNLN